MSRITEPLTKLSLKTVLTMLLVLLLLLSSYVILKGYLAGHFDSMESMRTYIGTFGAAAPVMLTAVQAIQVILPVLPGFFGCIVGAAMFGAMGGFWCNYIGISAGSVIAYFLARRFGIGLVQTLIPMEKYQSVVAWVNQKKCYTLILFLSILLPLAPDDFLCYFSGLMGMQPKRFVWIIALAKPWCILFYSIFFAWFL